MRLEVARTRNPNMCPALFRLKESGQQIAVHSHEDARRASRPALRASTPLAASTVHVPRPASALVSSPTRSRRDPIGHRDVASDVDDAHVNNNRRPSRVAVPHRAAPRLLGRARPGAPRARDASVDRRRRRPTPSPVPGRARAPRASVARRLQLFLRPTIDRLPGGRRRRPVHPSAS